MGQCFTRAPDPWQLPEWLGTDFPHGTHICPINDGVVHWSDTVKIPFQPAPKASVLLLNNDSGLERHLFSKE